jgi:hypothetical protein
MAAAAAARLRAGAGKTDGSDETKGRRGGPNPEKKYLAPSDAVPDTSACSQQRTPSSMSVRTVPSVGAWADAMAGWLGGLHIRQDKRAAPPGTDRSAWADGAGFPDGRWPFRTAWDGPSSAQVGPCTPPLESGCPLGGPPGLPSQEKAGGGGGVGAFQAATRRQRGLPSLGWLVPGSGKTVTANECPALAGLFSCTGYLDPHAAVKFWCCFLRAVSCEPVSMSL